MTLAITLPTDSPHRLDACPLCGLPLAGLAVWAWDMKLRHVECPSVRKGGTT